MALIEIVDLPIQSGDFQYMIRWGLSDLKDHKSMQRHPVRQCAILKGVSFPGSGEL